MQYRADGRVQLIEAQMQQCLRRGLEFGGVRLSVQPHFQQLLRCQLPLVKAGCGNQGALLSQTYGKVAPGGGAPALGIDPASGVNNLLCGCHAKSSSVSAKRPKASASCQAGKRSRNCCRLSPLSLPVLMKASPTGASSRACPLKSTSRLSPLYSSPLPSSPMRLTPAT